MKSMKTMMRVAGVLALLAVCASCGMPWGLGNSKNSDSNEPSEEGSKGTIRLSLPAELLGGGIGAAAVGTPSAQADTELLEILILEENPVASAGDLTIGDEPTVAASISVLLEDLPQSISGDTATPMNISVPAGTYRLLILAGTESGTTSCLLASAYTNTAVNVVQDQIADVTVNLATITHSVTVPETIPAGDTYQITAAGDTNSPVIFANSEGSTDTYQFQAKFDTESSLSVVDTNFTGSGWSISHTTQAPASETDQNWYSAWLLSGPYLTYKDTNTGAWTTLSGSFSRKWRWLGYTLLGESSALWEEVAVPLQLQPSTTGLDIGITWS